MEFTGKNSKVPEMQVKARNDIQKFIDAVLSGNTRKIWRVVDMQFRSKYKRKFVKTYVDEIREIELLSVHFTSSVMMTATFEIDSQLKKINFIAQNKAYKTNAEKPFLFNPISIRNV